MTATPSHPTPLAVTCGDPAGIGLDVTLAACMGISRVSLPPLLLIADADAVAHRARSLGLDVALHVLSDDAPLDARALPSQQSAKCLTVLHQPLAVPTIAGEPNPANGRAVVSSITRAVELTLEGVCSGVVTNPIAKHVLYDAGFTYPGHTEFLHALSTDAVPAQTAAAPQMLLASDALRVVPLTIHIPVADIPACLTQDAIIDAIETIRSDFVRYYGISNPRIAVSGLNPHAGEAGAIGREEVEIIAPALDAVRSLGIDCVGPLSADTMFHAAARETYDVALTMYHDQALIPAKTLAFDTAVNATLGLGFVRTSPDHGTAFELAGTGKASASSFIAAVTCAREFSDRARAHGDSLQAAR